MIKQTKFPNASWNLIVRCLMTLCLPASLSHALPQNTIRDNLTQNKIRTGYLSVDDISLVPQMVQNGLNVAMVKFHRFGPQFNASNISRLENWAQTCQQYQIVFMPVIDFLGHSEADWVTFSYYYTGDLVVPCPLEEQTFTQLITDPFCELAQMSLTQPIAGAILDNEMYASGLGHFYRQACTCDHCFTPYCQQEGLNPSIPLFERELFLEQNGRTDHYENYFRQAIRQLAQNTRQQVHQINPDFIIGGYHISEPYPFARGLVDGFATEPDPFFIVHNGTYFDGYLYDGLTDINADFAPYGSAVKHILGIWQSKFPPENLAEHLYFCAKDWDGYFIFTLATFNRPYFSPLIGEPQDYWDAYYLANSELDKLAADPDYQTHLTITPYSFVPVINPEIEDKQNVMYVTPPPHTPTEETAIRFRARNNIIFKADADQLIHLLLTSYQLSNFLDTTRLLILDSQGEICQDVTIEIDQTYHLSFIAPQNDTYTMILDSARNLIDVLGLTHPYAADTSRVIHLCQQTVPMFLWLPPGQNLGRVIFRGDGGMESYFVRFTDEDDNILAEKIVGTEETITISIPDNLHGKTLRLECLQYQDNLLEDISIEVESGFSPYISPYRSGLLENNTPPDDTTHPPAIIPLDDQYVTTGELLNFTIEAYDADGDDLTYYTTALPAGASFIENQFQWTAGPPDSYQAMFVASDGVCRDYESVAIYVSEPNSDPDPVNQPPQFTNLSDVTVDENSPLSFTVQASDPENDPLTYSVANLPPGAAFADQTFLWQPSYDAAGSYQVTFNAHDGHSSTSQIVTLTVNNVNRLPTLNFIEDKTIWIGSHLTFTVYASDPDQDPLTIFAEPLPDNATFVDNTFSWLPTSNDTGSHQITFTVNDGSSQTSQSALIQVNHIDLDDAPPVVTNCHPKTDDLQIPVNSIITLEICDYGVGVDPESITIHIENHLVYAGDVATYQSAFGYCRRLGRHTNYLFFSQPLEIFDYNQQIEITVNAADLNGNVMPPYAYTFMTEMHSFGAAGVIDDSPNLPKARPVVVSDKNHNIIWTAWESGPAGQRDIYLSQMSDLTIRAFVVPAKVTDNSSDQCHPQLAYDSNGAVYITYQDNRYGPWDIYLATSTNGINFTEKRITSSPNHQITPTIVIDQNDVIYLAWQDNQNQNQNIVLASAPYFQSDFTEILITSNPHDQTEPTIALDHQNTLYLAWTDSRNDSSDIYGAASNVGPWRNVPLVTDSGAQSTPVLQVQPNTSCLHLLWIDESGGDRDIFYASSPQGLPIDPLPGANIIDDASHAHQYNPALSIIGPGDNLKIFACWQDERNAADGVDTDIYFSQINSDSTVNILVTNNLSPQASPAIVTDTEGDPLILWIDGPTPQQTLNYTGLSAVISPSITSAFISAAQGGRLGPQLTAITDLDDVSVEIPPHAFWSDVNLTVHAIKNPTQSTFAVTPYAAYEFGPSSSLEFAAPLTITIPYQPDQSHQTSTVYWYNPATDSHSQSGLSDIETIVLSPDLHAVSFNTTHFSQFVIVTHTESASLSASGGGGCSLTAGPCYPGQVLSYFLPYLVLLLSLLLIRFRDAHKSPAS